MLFLLLKKKQTCSEQLKTTVFNNSVPSQYLNNVRGKNHFGNEKSIQGHRARIGAPHHAWEPSTAKLTGGSHVSAEFYYQKPSDSWVHWIANLYSKIPMLPIKCSKKNNCLAWLPSAMVCGKLVASKSWKEEALAPLAFLGGLTLTPKRFWLLVSASTFATDPNHKGAGAETCWCWFCSLWTFVIVFCFSALYVYRL